MLCIYARGFYHVFYPIISPYLKPKSTQSCAAKFNYNNLFIHSHLISCPLIGSLVKTRSVLKMSYALRILFLVRGRARERHIDWSFFPAG